MKTLDKQHKLAYQDVFLYTRITSRIVNTDFYAEVSTPFKYKDGEPMELYLDDDVVVGIGQRNFQRDRLFNNRGKLLIVRGVNSEHQEKIIGKYNKLKHEVTLYPTERLLPEEIKILSLLNKHLTANNISVIIELDEKARYRNEIRRRRGDKVQSREIDH